MLTFWGPAGGRHCDGVSRRNFLRVGGLGVAGLTLADVFRLRAAGQQGGKASPPGKAVIMILLGGGPSHIDMYDLKPGAPAEVRGEFKPIRTTVPGLDVCELMPQQAKAAERLALVRNLQMTTSSHNYMEITSGFLWGRQIPGGKGNPRPAFGSVVSRLRGGDRVPPFVSLWNADPAAAEDPAYLGLAHRPFHPSGPGLENLALTKGMTLDRLGDRKQLLHAFDGLRREADGRGQLPGLDAFTARALEMIASPRTRDAFDVSREPERVRVRYGLTPDLPVYNANYLVLKQFLLARRLVEAGVAVVSLQAFGEWDTHYDNFKSLRRMVPVVDRGVAALVSDLHERGLDKDVAVVMWGEFGRGPKIYSLNGHPPGRDHHGPANFVLFAGGGLKTGQVVGATDRRGERPVGRPYTPQNVLATLYHVLGIDPATTLADHSGRPVALLDDRRQIEELL
jgi:hypothetical protein